MLRVTVNYGKGKSSVLELHFFLNIMMVIDNIIIKKGIHYLLSDSKSTAKSVNYLHSQSVNDRRHSLKPRPPGIPVREFPGIRHFKNSRREFPGISEFLAKNSVSS